ncbi:MAG: cytochrome-c peroxidase [Aureispira sp.]|nr:cytochrome-c peroxidase [Aureispira sp.]
MYSNALKTLLLFNCILFLTSCTKDKTTDLDHRLDEILLSVSGGIGKSFFKLPQSSDFTNIPQDPKNPLSSDKVKLGKYLFHETGLSNKPKLTIGQGTYSCASCHHANAGFQANMAQGIGEGGWGYGIAGESRSVNSSYIDDSIDVQPIRTPAALNTAYQKVMLWNGQFGATGPNSNTQPQWTSGSPKEDNHLGYEGVETQAIAGLKVHRMIVDTSFIFNNGYKALFDAAFAHLPTEQRYTRETAGLAIAAYERTLLANQSPFQQWLNGDLNAMTQEEKEGAILFFGKAECAQCHTGPALSSMEFYALGCKDLVGNGFYGLTTQNKADAAKGRGGFTGDATDMYKFKVSQLYNLLNSPFYGHGASFGSVQEILIYKNQAVSENATVPNTQLASEFKPLGLSTDEITAISKFIETSLLDRNLNRYVPNSLPSGNCIINADGQSKIDLGCN